MISIGERLRRQRLQNRTSLEKVSLETKISVRMLEAIEAGEFDKLPGGVFRRSFILQYARALYLDPDDIAADLDQLQQFDEVPALPAVAAAAAGDSKSSPAFSFREDLGAFQGSTIGSVIAAVCVIMACALVYNWWQTASAKVESASTPPAPPSEIAHREVPRTEVARTEVARTEVARTEVAHTEVARMDASRMEPAHSEVVVPPPAAGRSDAPAAPPATAGQSSAKPADTSRLRVALSADERTWVSVSSDGKNVFSQSLEAHETKIVEATGKVRLLVGNAGGVEISLNGKPIGPIGPRGQVRVVELTPAGFQIVPRTPPTLEPL